VSERLDRERDEIRSAIDWALQTDDAEPVGRLLTPLFTYWLTLSTRSQLALLAGDHAAARRMHEEALGAARAIDNHYLQAQILDMLGLDAATVGDMAAARDRYAAPAELHIRLLDYEGSAYGLSGFAGLALAQGRATAAARLIGASGYARQSAPACTSRTPSVTGWRPLMSRRHRIPSRTGSPG
jgi:hypothetical protein